MGLHVEVIKISECALTDSQHEDMRDRGELRPHFEDSEEYMYFMFNRGFFGEGLESGWYKAVCLACKSMGSYSRLKEFRRWISKIAYMYGLKVAYTHLYTHLNDTYLNKAIVLDDMDDRFLNRILGCESSPLYPFMSVSDCEGVLTASECKTTLGHLKKLEGMVSKQADKNLLEEFKTWVGLLELAVDNGSAFIVFK